MVLSGLRRKRDHFRLEEDDVGLVGEGLSAPREGLGLQPVIADWILRYLWLGRQILEELAIYYKPLP